MVGLYGVVGTPEYGVEALGGELAGAGDELSTTSIDDDLEILLSSHPQFHEEQPATAADDARVWVYGSIYGYDGPAGYESRPDDTATAAYCARLYDDHGLDVVEGLNGEFVGVVLDRERDELHVFTDRIGSVPLFYTGTDDAILFATRLQSIGLHPGIQPAFDRDYLAEYFALQKAFGTATVLEDVLKQPPASIRTFGLDGTIARERVYWRPRYRPVDRSPRELADVLAETLDAVFDDRIRADLDYGVMLSGGTDSRLVLAGVSERTESATAYHLTNWESRETRAAERVAQTAGVDLRRLQRDADYHVELLDRVPAFTNFVGTFDEHIASGFGAELDDVDVVLSGYLGDTLFGRFPLYLRSSPLPFTLPNERRVKSIADYLDLYLDRYETPAAVPGFLDAPDITGVLLDRMRTANGTIHHHGVTYPSLRELQLCEYYPLTNQYAWANTDSLRQITGHTSPFFDNRLLAVHLTIPAAQRIRFDPIALALRDRASALARIPHGWTGVPPAKSVRYGPRLFARKVIARLRHRVTDATPPAPYLSHQPWIDEGELVRNHDFVERAIERNAERIDAIPALDREAVERCYREHLAGTDHWRALYALVTLLESPVANRIASEQPDD